MRHNPDFYRADAPPGSFAAGHDLGRTRVAGGLDNVLVDLGDVSTLEQLMLAETRMYHITVKVVSPTEDQGAARVRLKSNTIVFPQHVIVGGSTRVPGPFDGSAALDAALERVQCIFVGPKGRRSTLERTALMVPDLRLAPAVLLNALRVRFLLHGGDPPGVSVESLRALGLEARVSAHVAKQTLLDGDVSRRLEARAAAANDVHNVRIGAMDAAHADGVALDAGDDANAVEHVYAGVFQEGGSELKLYFDSLAKLVRNGENVGGEDGGDGCDSSGLGGDESTGGGRGKRVVAPTGVDAARAPELLIGRDEQPLVGPARFR